MNKLLHTPLTVHNVELANRLVMPPMATGKTPDGTVQDDLLAYYDARSKGGYIGLIVTEHAYVSPEGKAHEGQLSVSRDTDIPGLTKLVETIHKNNTRVIAQINHAGGAAMEEITGYPAISASVTAQSEYARKSEKPVREMTADDMHTVAKKFSEAMSEVNDKYYEEAANYHCKKHGWVKFTSLAACAAIVLAVSFATLWKLPSQTTPQPEYEPPIITNPDNQSDNPEQGISLNLNEIKELNATSGSIALMADDYTAMSYEELLRYFDVSLPITETLPYLTLQSNDFGIYQTDNRGIYYDGNFIEFRNSGGTQDINIVLSKVFKHTSDVFDLSADELQFTEINGRELAVFHYTNENGTDCYYAEFLQNDVAFVVSSENISMEDYAKCLQVLVEKAQQNSGSVNTITGEIVVIDPYANHIGVRLDKEQAPEYSSVYGIDLPDGQSAGDYSLGDRVEVMYTGEPATILTIWAEQLVDIKLLK